MPDASGDDRWPDARQHDIMAGERRLSRPDSALPDWHIPDASYRPIPIAWFAAAFLAQMVALTAIFAALVGISGWLTIAVSALVTGVLAQWTWMRGMKDAAPGWQAATVLVLAAQLGLVCAGAATRL